MAYVNFYHSKTEEEALEASVQTGNTGKVYFSNDATTIVKNGVKYGSIAEDIKGLQVKDVSFIHQQVGGGLNTPSGLAQLTAMRGKSVISNEKILNFNAESLKTVGFNQWDEQWELGDIIASTGELVSSTDRIRTKNFIHVFPNTQYCISYVGSVVTSSTSLIPYVIFYDAAQGFVSSTSVKVESTNKNKTFTVPTNAAYAKFYFLPSYGTTYNHDICINISDPSKNGTYEPYWKSNLPLNINTLTGKLNGSGESIVVFPDGMAGMNGVQDTIIGNTAVKKFYQVNDLTTLPITLNYEGYAPEEEGGDTVYSFILELPKNAKAFTSAVMNGLFNKKYSAAYGISAASSNNFYIYNLQGKSYVEIMDDDFSTDARFDDEEQWDALIADIRTSLVDKALLYELGTYEEYTLDDMAMPLSYKIDKDGTEQIIPNSTDPDNTVPSTVPCDMTVKYKLSYVEESQKLFDNVSATQVQDFTNSKKNIARENIGIKADDIHLWDSSVLENMNLFSQAFYMDINKASSLGATRIDVGGNMHMRSLWEKSCVSILMDENGNYCELNPNDNRYTKEGDYLLNDDGTIVSGFAHCDFMKIIPLTYGRVQMVTENGNTFPRLWLSLIPLPGGYIIPQQVVAKLKASVVSGALRSLPGLVTADSNTINAFWTKAQARSKNHGLANLDFRNHLLFHMMSKYAYRDSQNCKGQDNTPICGVGLDGTENRGGLDGQKNIKTGIVLSLGDYDGNVATTDANSNTCHCVNVAGFENPWGQKWEMVQGLCSVGTDVYCWRNNWLPTGTPTAESFTNVEHVKLTRATSAVTGMNIIESQQGQGVYMIPKQSLSGVRYGDNFWYSKSGQLWLFGGNSNSGSNCGLTYVDSSSAWTTSDAGCSARLAYYGSLNKVSATKMKDLGNS